LNLEQNSFLVRSRDEIHVTVNFPNGRPTVCFIDLAALRWNLRQVKAKVGPAVKILSMVKANAYGHGAAAVAKALADEGGYAFGVATLEEAIELRQAGIDQPILVVTGVYLEQLGQFIEHRLTPVAHDLEALKLLDRAAQGRSRDCARRQRSKGSCSSSLVLVPCVT